MKFILTICLVILSLILKVNVMTAQTIPAISPMQAVTLRLKPHQDLKALLDEYVKSLKIKAACIVTCVGSLERVAIRYANQSETTISEGKFEIVSLTGILAESGSHLHISVSDSTGKTIGGHLKEGSLIYTTAELVLGIMPGVEYEREVDSTYGYKELVVRKKKAKK